MRTTATEDDRTAPAPKASLRSVKPEYQRNGLRHVVYFTQATHLPSDVSAYGREAPNCFDQKRYLATIILASAMVEVILNKDTRMLRLGGGWRNLNMKFLKEAGRKGFPVARLLGTGESFGGASIEFIELRNRIAHGNLSGIVGFEHRGTPDYSPEARERALNHLRKAEDFVVDWYNTSPDVQERRIRHHRWPTP
jgi:hypothetical protein